MSKTLSRFQRAITNACGASVVGLQECANSAINLWGKVKGSYDVQNDTFLTRDDYYLYNTSVCGKGRCGVCFVGRQHIKPFTNLVKANYNINSSVKSTLKRCKYVVQKMVTAKKLLKYNVQNIVRSKPTKAMYQALNVRASDTITKRVKGNYITGLLIRANRLSKARYKIDNLFTANTLQQCNYEVDTVIKNNLALCNYNIGNTVKTMTLGNYNIGNTLMTESKKCQYNVFNGKIINTSSAKANHDLTGWFD